jgi:hypothetical protein
MTLGKMPRLIMAMLGIAALSTNLHLVHRNKKADSLESAFSF